MRTRLFSSSEVASHCLRDRARTEAFRAAIAGSVRQGDLVVEIGAGSGILSLFAAAAGAGRVVAVESDSDLAEILAANVRVNGLEHVIEVVAGDGRQIDLPLAADVVIAELIDTWLLDEHQLQVLSRLRRDGVITRATRLIPALYDGWATLGEADFTEFGFELPFPGHIALDFADESGWRPLPFRRLTETIRVFSLDFMESSDSLAEMTATTIPIRSGVANAVRLSGEVDLGAGVRLGETVAFNGSKILPIARAPVRRGEQTRLRFGSGAASKSLARWRCEVVGGRQ